MFPKVDWDNGYYDWNVVDWGAALTLPINGKCLPIPDVIGNLV